MQAVLSANTTRSWGLRELLFRSSRRPHVIARRCSALAAPHCGRELVEWVLSNGGSVQGVAVQQWDGEGEASGYGLRAVQDCRAGACLISLPQRCHLTYDAASDPRLLSLIEQVPQELWGAKLALQVLAHRVQGEASPFATYIANLPVGVPGLPMFFNGEALAALQYPPVTEQVKRRCRWLLTFSQQLLAPLRGTAQDPFNGAAIDANALGWALGVVTSRAFRVRGPSQPAAMLPLIDMANHSFSPNCKIAAARGGDLHMVALRDLAAGEPVLLSYGNLSNDFLLLDYGFVVPGNAFDTVQLRFDPGLLEVAKSIGGVKASSAEDAAELPAWQAVALRALGLAGEGANGEVSILQVGAKRRSGGSSGTTVAGTAGERQEAQQTAAAAVRCPVDARLLAGTRVLCARNAGEVAGRSPEQLEAWDKPLSPQSEVATLRTLSGLCLVALSQFTTSLQDDQAALQQHQQHQQQEQQEQQQQEQPSEEERGLEQAAPAPLSPDVRLALQFRAGKKQLLVDAMVVLSERIQELAAAEQGKQAEGASGKQAKGKVPAAKHGGKGFGR